MESPIDRGLPFVAGDLWRSPLSIDAVGEKESIFTALDTALPSLGQLNAALEHDSPHFELGIDLQFPTEQTDRTKQAVPTFDNAATSPDADAIEFDLSIWSAKDVISHTEQPRLRTWEAFYQKEGAHSDDLALLSEAGPLPFDAAVSAFAPRNKVGVLPQAYCLRSLCSLALGRASSLFQWDESKASFLPTLEGVSISGVSDLCSISLIDSLVKTGNLFNRLRSFVEFQQIHHQKSPARSAVRSCVAAVLGAIDESLSEQLGDVHSLLQLQSLISRPRKVLNILDMIVVRVKSSRDEKGIISHVAQCIDGELATDSQLQQVFATFVARMSVPWLERLANSVGFPDPANVLILDNSVAAGEIEPMDDIPDFVSSEDALLLRQTSEAVSTLRRYSPSHALVANVGGVDARSAFEYFSNADFTQTQAEQCAHRYEMRYLSMRPPLQPNSNIDAHSTPVSADCLNVEPKDHTAYITDLQASMSENISVASVHEGQLREYTLAACRADSQDQDFETSLGNIDYAIAPFDRVRPLVVTQNRLVTEVLLRQLFVEHCLLDHFDIQRQFHLFGNGEFVTRLSTALFSTDVQSAERRRGKTPTAEAMGLRLGTTHEERWPPASSELQLTLMGILAEAYVDTSEKTGAVRSPPGKLPEGLSFAIRQLPEKDIERVLDPNSIYALDFLRLQYMAKPPLTAIFTAGTLEDYDQIFCFLLRLLRLTHVTAFLPGKARGRRQSAPDISTRRFTIQARTFVSVLAAHMVDVGVTAPWQAFERETHRIRSELDSDGARDRSRTREKISMQGLRQLHDACLGRIRNRLFLKRKQEKVRAAIETILSTILRGTFLLQTANSSEVVECDEILSELDRSIRTLLSLLRSIADRPAKDATAPDAEDAEMAGHLLLKLNWNSFYNEDG